VHQILAANFPRSRFLSAEATAALLDRLAESNVAGGAVYDALVGAVAVQHQLPLVTRDDRALDVYRALGVEVFARP
jgi:predicted nucleic acid-binding protein